MSPPIVMAGDPHGNFSPILRACAQQQPGNLILVGDCDLRAPLRHVLASLFAMGWRVHWILGNRDTDSEEPFDNLVGDFPEGDIGGRVIELDGIRIAGLAGVFKPRVWYPRRDEPHDVVAPPRFNTRAEFLASIDRNERWRGGLPLWHRDTIFPEDIATLARQRFDVLVAHEAPTSHRHGFEVIDRLAEMSGARLIVHGHHHQSYGAALAEGIAVRGLGVAEPWLLELP